MLWFKNTITSLRKIAKAIHPIQIFTLDRHVCSYSVDCCHKNSERNISVVIQLLSSTI